MRQILRVRSSNWTQISAIVPVLFVLAIGCSDFYTADPTSTPGPARAAIPESEAIEDSEILEIVAEQARVAIGERLGEDVSEVEIDEITGQPFTDLAPGCMPRPAGYDGEYIIPGLIVSAFYDDIRYEFHSDKNASVGALCESVAQILLFTELGGLGVIGNPAAFLGGVVTANDLAEGQALMDDFPGAISIQLDDIDWDIEDLVGTTVSGTGCSFSAEASSVEWDIDGEEVLLRIHTVSEGDCEPLHLRPVFILIEGRPPGVPFRVLAGPSDDIGGPNSPVASGSTDGPAPLLATPTPNAAFEALETAIAGGN